MGLTLSALDISILLKCNKQDGLISKAELSQSFRSYETKEKERATKNLAKQGLILAQELPKPSGRRVPIFYKLTEKGRQWVKEYNKNYP